MFSDYAKMKPSLFSRYLPTVLPSTSVHDLEQYIAETRQMQEDMKMIPEFRGYDIHDTKKTYHQSKQESFVFFIDRRKLYLVNLDLPNSLWEPCIIKPFICIIFLELGTCIAVGPKYFLSVSSIFKDRWKIYPSWLCLFWGKKVRL